MGVGDDDPVTVTVFGIAFPGRGQKRQRHPGSVAVFGNVTDDVAIFGNVSGWCGQKRQ